MVEARSERQAVIEWFKTDFSEEARRTTRTSRLADGKLSYRFSVTNTLPLDFSKFSFKVKIVNRDNGSELGTASINAGEWAYGETKNFKSKLSIPDNVRNIAFIMFAESIDYELSDDSVLTDPTSFAQEMGREMGRELGRTLGKAGEDLGGVLGELFGTGGMPQTDAAPAPQRSSGNRPAGGSASRPAPTGTSGTANRTSTRTNARPTQTTSTVGDAARSFTQRKLQKKLNKQRLGRSGWIVAGASIGVLFALAAAGSEWGSPDQLTFGAIAVVSLVSTLIGKLSLNKKAKRIRAYETRINKKGNTSLDDLAAYVGRPVEKVSDDLHQMILDGFFPECYIDFDKRMLVMTRNGEPIEDVERSAALNKKAKRKAGKDSKVAPESLDDLITMTDDTEIKAKLKALRTVTKNIDARVEAVPELEAQVKDFREKYYPEVVRLTDEYNDKIADMGKYREDRTTEEVSESASGSPVLNANPNYLQEQAAEIKSQLISLIDSVTEASDNLLEKLHEEDIMDITTDIKMLQTTLASKGLLDSDFDIR